MNPVVPGVDSLLTENLLAHINSILNSLNMTIIDTKNKFTNEQIKRLASRFTDLLGNIGPMAIKLGTLQGEISTLKHSLKNQTDENPIRSRSSLVFNVAQPKYP